MLSEHEKLDTLAHLGIELNRVQDLDILMEQILSEAHSDYVTGAVKTFKTGEDMLRHLKKQ